MYNPKIDYKVIIFLMAIIFVVISKIDVFKSERKKQLEIKTEIQKELDLKKQQKDTELARIEKEKELKRILLLPGCDLKTPEGTIMCYFSSLKRKSYIQTEWCYDGRATGSDFSVACSKEYTIISKKSLNSAYIKSYGEIIYLNKPTLFEIVVKNKCNDGEDYEDGRNLHLHFKDNKWFIYSNYSNDPDLD